MDRPYIERLRVRNYGCIKDLELKLTPLHALIGPNDSGKSTVLMALRTLTTLAAGPIQYADDHGKLLAAMELNPQYSLAVTVAGQSWGVASAGVPSLYFREQLDSGIGTGSVNGGSSQVRSSATLRASVAGSVLLRLEPDALRMPTELIEEGQPLRFRNALGFGLPAIYDAIVTRDLVAYTEINKELARLFPTVRSLSLKNKSTTTKAVGVQLANGVADVGADFMSEGMLYYLAYAALPHLDQTAVILIEEPENGLHPSRIHDVVRVLRAIANKTQVVIATHSPLVINELEPDEVTVLTRDPDQGTQARPIKETPNFEERSKVYALGELWVSYANGDDEAPLLTGGSRA